MAVIQARLRAGPRRSRPRTSSRRLTAQRDGVARGLQGRQVEPLVAATRLTTPDAAGPVQAGVRTARRDRIRFHRCRRILMICPETSAVSFLLFCRALPERGPRPICKTSRYRPSARSALRRIMRLPFAGVVDDHDRSNLKGSLSIAMNPRKRLAGAVSGKCATLDSRGFSPVRAIGLPCHWQSDNHRRKRPGTRCPQRAPARTLRRR